MNSETSIVAAQCRIREWAEQIRECQNRPEGMKVTDWCKDHGSQKRTTIIVSIDIRIDLSGAIPEEPFSNPVVPVKQELLMPEQTNRNIMDSGLEIHLGDCVLHVTETTSASLLSKVIGVIRDAQ